MKTKILISAIFLSLFFTDCKKYPEDDGISFKSALHRLTIHPWKVTAVLYNGNYINYLYNDSLNLGDIEELQLDFNYSKTPDEEPKSNVNYTYNGLTERFSADGNWEIYNKKTRIYIKNFVDNFTVPDTNALKDAKILNNLFFYTWTISKLYKSDFIIKNSKNYEIIFKEVK